MLVAATLVFRSDSLSGERSPLCVRFLSRPSLLPPPLETLPLDCPTGLGVTPSLAVVVVARVAWGGVVRPPSSPYH